MSKITLSTVGSISQNPTSAATAINANNAIIQAAMDNTLSRDGTSPDQMAANIDMNSHRIINLPVGVGSTEPVTTGTFNTAVIGKGNVPLGGSTNQVLAKNSATNYDTKWIDEASSLTPGSNISITGTSPATINTTQNPNFTTSVTTPTLVLNGTTVAGITGTGNLVASTSPTLVTPVLGTPASGVATNLTGTAAGLTAGSVTTNANLTGVITSVGNATSISSQTGTGTKFVTDTSPTLVTPILGTPTSGNLSNCTAINATQLTSGTIPAARTNGHLNGTATNDNAAASEIGEFITGTGTGNSITSATAFNAVSISLTAGDWDVSGNIAFTFAATTTCQAVAISVSTTTATIGATSTVNSYNFGSTSTLAPNGNFTISSPVVRISVSGTTTVFLVGLSNFGTSTVSIANGASFIRARRIR